jgi:four helix bundle protein
MDYAVAIYEFVASLPEHEKYNLASQLRRAVTSAPLNIAEGCGAGSNTEFGRFLSYAYRSLKEVVTALELCERLYPLLLPDRMQSLIDEGNQISKTQNSELNTQNAKGWRPNGSSICRDIKGASPWLVFRLRPITQVSLHPVDPQSNAFAPVDRVRGCVSPTAKGHKLRFDSVIF